MKKIVRLTESDLMDLIKKVIGGQNNNKGIEMKGMEMPNQDKMKALFLSQDDSSPEIKQLSNEVKNIMKSCVSENGLYKVKSFLNGFETKKGNFLSTIMTALFDKNTNGKSIGQEFTEFHNCVRKKSGGKLDNL